MLHFKDKDLPMIMIYTIIHQYIAKIKNGNFKCQQESRTKRIVTNLMGT